MRNITLEEVIQTYGVENWGAGYFEVNRKGHLAVRPAEGDPRSVDIKELIDHLIDQRKLQLTHSFAQLGAEAHLGTFCALEPIGGVDLVAQMHFVNEVWDRISLHQEAYPLSPPDAKPSIKRRWRIKNNTMTGRIMNRDHRQPDPQADRLHSIEAHRQPRGPVPSRYRSIREP